MRETVHRPRWRHADIPVADAAGIILQARLRARREHIDAGILVIVSGERRGEELALEKCLRMRKRTKVIEIGLDAVDAGGLQRRRELRRCFVAGVPLHDHLGEHRIVERRDLSAGRNPAIDADALRKRNLGEKTGGRLEVAARIFRVEADLHRMAGRSARVAFEGPELARGLRDHHFHEIEAGHFFRHRMLDLEARVHFEEIELLFILVIDEFDGACRRIGYSRAEAHRRLVQCASLRLSEIGRGRFLDHLLVAALGRTVALAQRDDIAIAVAENLHLDMARAGDIFFEKETAILEVRQREAAHCLVEARQLLRRMAELQADAAAARRAFQHHRITDLVGFRQSLVEIDDERRAGQKRHVALLRDLARGVLERKGAHMLRARPDEGNTLARERSGEFRVLAEKPVAGMHRLRARFAHGLENGIHVEIAFRDRRRADASCLVRETDVRREAVRLRIDGDGRNTHPPERPDDADRDFAAIGDQYLAEHLASSGARRRHAPPGGKITLPRSMCARAWG